ncbi:MAG: hypothetical protein ACLPYS_20455 [Vulcanimicrobiaceae bacterium]
MSDRPRSNVTGFVLAEFVLGCVLFALLVQSVQRMTWIASHFPRELVLGGLIVVAAGLFELRRRVRFAFATLELLAGIGLLALAAHDAGRQGLWLIEAVGGLYVAVDSFDNIAKAG